jgi:hypothetical protein
MSCVAYDPTFHKVRYLAGTGAGRIPVERRGQVIAEWSCRTEIDFINGVIVKKGARPASPLRRSQQQAVTPCGLYETLCLK